MKLIIILCLVQIFAGCNASKELAGTYKCHLSSGNFGSMLNFTESGGLFLSFATDEQVARIPNLAHKQNVPGTYELIEDHVVIKYFDGTQEHTLQIVKDGFISETNLFSSCKRLK